MQRATDHRLRALMPEICGVEKVRGRACRIARDAAPFVVDRAEPHDRRRVALRGGEFGPLPGDHVIFFGLAVEVDAAQGILRVGMALLGGGAEQRHRMVDLAGLLAEQAERERRVEPSILRGFRTSDRRRACCRPESPGRRDCASPWEPCCAARRNHCSASARLPDATRDRPRSLCASASPASALCRSSSGDAVIGSPGAVKILLLDFRAKREMTFFLIWW